MQCLQAQTPPSFNHQLNHICSVVLFSAHGQGKGAPIHWAERHLVKIQLQSDPCCWWTKQKSCERVRSLDHRVPSVPKSRSNILPLNSSRKCTPANIGFILQMELFSVAFVETAARLLGDGADSTNARLYRKHRGRLDHKLYICSSEGSGRRKTLISFIFQTHQQHQ